MPVTRATAIAAAMNTHAIGSIQEPTGSRTNSPVPTAWSSVLSLPPRLAGITPCRITQKRSSVTPSSRPSIRVVTHHGRSPSADSAISAAPINALSAIGSASLPNSGMRPRLRARSPSMRSVIDATAKIAAAIPRHTSSCPPCANIASRKTGTRTSRNTVSAFATFHAETALGGSPIGSSVSFGSAGLGIRSASGSRPSLPVGRSVTGSRPSRSLATDRLRDEVGAVSAGDACRHEVADLQLVRTGQPHDSVDVRALVRGTAEPLAVVELLDEHVDLRPDAIFGALRDELVGKRADPRDALRDHVGVQLAVEPRGLRPVLVGVAEDADRIQARLGQEAFELGY